MVNLLGLHLQVLMGTLVPLPIPLKLSEALESVQITLKDKEDSGFQLVFQIGRSALDIKDYSLLKETQIKPFNRTLINVIFGIKPQPIMDGIITNHQLEPGADPGTSKLTVMGKDLSILLDLEQKAEAYPNLNEKETVSFVVLRELGKYGVTVDATSTEGAHRMTVDEQTPTQDKKTTHLGYIRKLAERFGYVFYIEPGPVPATNVAYWGPPPRRGPPQGALSVNMGPNTNVEKINFKYDEAAPKRIRYESEANQEKVVSEYSRTPRLASRIPTARKLEFLVSPDGLTDQEARRARAQGKVNESFDGVTTASGTLDALRYGRILRPRMLLDVRGAGEHYDGSFYVNEVTHNIDVKKGEYKQNFKISRAGVGAASPTVTT